MIVVPNGHVEDDDEQVSGTFTPAQPVLPSRATGQDKPLTPLPPNELNPPARARPSRKVPAKVAAPKKPAKRAPKKAVAKPRRKTAVKKARKVANAPVAPKNPNRPLEAKNRLHAVMTVVAGMSKGETTAFMGAMSMLEDMPRGARRKVIGALGQVYG